MPMMRSTAPMTVTPGGALRRRWSYVSFRSRTESEALHQPTGPPLASALADLDHADGNVAIGGIGACWSGAS
jgi:hypothetical protein